MKSNSDYKILLIEDEDTMRKPLAEALDHEGFTVVSANDGISGLDAAINGEPDLILLDIAMPKMDGIAVLKKLRESGEYGKRAKVVIITNMSMDERIMKGITEYEPSFMLLKNDWKLTSVVHRVKEALGLIKPESISQ